MKRKCPKCGKECETKHDELLDVDYVTCTCGYNGLDELESVPGERETQREKRKYTPYRAGRK